LNLVGGSPFNKAPTTIITAENESTKKGFFKSLALTKNVERQITIDVKPFSRLEESV